ncbi:neurochondrin family protein [Perilla frutescens var. frutescens]|nr:neurochondrin family protein [Perilla frutescens var. frutescens]
MKSPCVTDCVHTPLLSAMAQVCAVEKLHALVLAECCISIVREEWLIGPNHFPDGHSSLYADRCILLVLESFRVEIVVHLNELAYLKIMEIESPFRFCYSSWKVSGPVVVADGTAEAAMYEYLLDIAGSAYGGMSGCLKPNATGKGRGGFSVVDVHPPPAVGCANISSLFTFGRDNDMYQSDASAEF